MVKTMQRSGGRYPLNLLALEPRFMFDGAGAVDAVEAVAASTDDGSDVAPAAADGGETASHVVFIDAAIADIQPLLDGVPAGAQIFVLDSDRDGVTQIADILKDFEGVSSVHVFSHGDVGSVSLGNAVLDGNSLDNHAGSLAAWGAALSETGDILFYGCSVGADGNGADFIDRVAALTGADVAASDDATGAAALGGDWVLEASAGSIESTTIEASSYSDILATPVLDNTKSPALTTINEDIGAPTNGSTANSTLVSALIASGGSLSNYSDGDNDLPGIAVTGINANGTLYYSTDGGANWTASGARSQTSALMLMADASTRVYFAPNANYNGSISDAITFKAWDRTGGYTNGQVGVDVGTTTTLTLTGTLDTSGVANVVAVSGNYAYVADGLPGLHLINISDPANPSLTSTYDPASSYSSVNHVVVSGNYAYVADGWDGLRVINISTPETPSQTGTYNTSGHAYSVAVSGNFAYVADGDAGLQVIDISNLASPSLTGTYDTTGTAYAVAVSGNYAYVAGGASGLQVINISDPANPSLTATYDTSDNTYDVTVSGNYAYVADYNNGLLVIDISDPTNPSLTGTYDTTGAARRVTVSGNYAYVADGASGLHVINISNPASPSLTASYNTSGNARGVAISGNYAYVADNTDGLQVITRNDGNATVSTANDTASLTVTAIADTPSVASPTVNEDTDSGAIAITRAAGDGAETTHYKITAITGGTLYSDAGYTTQIADGSFIASAGATTNVYFRPTADRNTDNGGNGSFTVQASKSNADAGLDGATVTSTVTLTPVDEPAPAPAPTPSPSPAPPPPPPAPPPPSPPVTDGGPVAPLATVVRDSSRVSTVFQPLAASGLARDASATTASVGEGGGYQIATLASGRPGQDSALVTLRPVAFLPVTGAQINFTLPADTFASSSSDASVSLSASLIDGSALPGWLSFDSGTGKFTGQRPDGMAGEVVVRVIARDQQGNEAIATIRIDLGDGQAQGEGAPGQSGEAMPEAGAPVIKLSEWGGKPAGKPTFAEELRMASRLSGARQAQMLAAAHEIARNG